MISHCSSQFATSLGVVPIFVNAGAALVPTIIATVTSVAAILLKPKELIDVLRRKPWILVAVILVVGAISFLIWHSSATPLPAAKPKSERPAGYLKTDWNAYALSVIHERENASKTSGIKPQWSYPAEDGMVLSSPVAANGKVFCTAAVQDVGSFYGIIYAVDAKTGREIWKVDKLAGEDLKPFFSSPVLTADNKYLVIGQGLHTDTNCNLICLEADTGKLQWKVKTPLHIESSPAVKGDLAVVGAGAIEDASHKPVGDPGYVFAVRISDGKELWKHPVNDPESSPAIADDGTVYIGSGFNGNAVVALRSETDEELKAKGLKRELWKAPAKYPITGPITLVDDLVIVGGGNGDFVYEDPSPAGVVMAINRKTGVIQWEAKTESAVLGKIVPNNGTLYCPVRNGQVIAIKQSDGSAIWKQSVSGKSPILGGIAVLEQTVFAVSKDGYLALLNAADGKIVEKHLLNNSAKPGDKGLTLSTPALHGNQLFIGSETGGLRSFVLIDPPK